MAENAARTERSAAWGQSHMEQAPMPDPPPISEMMAPAIAFWALPWEMAAATLAGMVQHMPAPPPRAGAGQPPRQLAVPPESTETEQPRLFA
jgi:hypothetical protein